MMNCKEFQDQVNAILEVSGELPRELHEHMSRCPACLRYWKRAEVFWEARRPAANVDEAVQVAEESTITRIAYTIIQQGIRSDASDIAVWFEEHGVRVSYRVGDELLEGISLPGYVEVPLVARFKVMADADVHCDDRPQEGTIPIRWNDQSYRVISRTIPDGVYERIEARIERV